jgi:lipopolysaccharide/colanic/teichoic acid biosynthesis glycosyltransferase
MLKRAFDIAAAIVGLAVLTPLLAAVAVCVRLGSPGPVFFVQRRMGRGFRPFHVYKFRSMRVDAPERGAQITAGEDPRITWIGRILRKAKLDEFPQLYNVLRGDMSLVGPRPEVPKYVEIFRRDYEEILRVRPGITDLASIAYCDEAAILGRAQDPEQEYLQRVLPEKIRLAKEYIRRQSFWLDQRIILRTVLAIIVDHVGMHAIGRDLGRRRPPVQRNA